MEIRKTIILFNSRTEIEKLHNAVAEFASHTGLSKNEIDFLNIALDEIVVNIISYAYEDTNLHEIIINLMKDEQEITVEIEDDGRPFNPLTNPDPNIEMKLEDRTIGGLGLYFVRNLSDRVDYRRDGEKNLLIVKKNIFSKPS